MGLNVTVTLVASNDLLDALVGIAASAAALAMQLHDSAAAAEPKPAEPKPAEAKPDAKPAAAASGKSLQEITTAIKVKAGSNPELGPVIRSLLEQKGRTRLSEATISEAAALLAELADYEALM
jgi:hypothetical protein